MREVDDFLWISKARQVFGVSGKGRVVAALDTGLNADHVDFAGRVLPGRNFTPDAGGDPNKISDGNGNGTNCAGIILASGDHVGVAPEARIVPLKVLRNNGGGSFPWVVEALDWTLQNYAALNISAVSLMLGDGGNYVSDTQFSGAELTQRIVALSQARVAVVVPAGNDYHTHGSQQGMTYPAIVRHTISVGAVYDAEEGSFSYGSGAKALSTRAGQITPFSQRLQPTVNGTTYTDVFAPGAPITSSGINGQHGESVQHGTVQAGAVVTGLVLLLQDLSVQMTGVLPPVEDLTSWLRRGSVTIFDGDDEDDEVEHTLLPYPRVDAFLALYEARRALRTVNHAVAAVV